jgi:hypothetical protein
MKLDEAKELLKRAGYLVRSLNEDTETNDDEYNDVNDDIDAYYDRKHKHSPSLLHRKWDLEDKHGDLDDKIRNAKRFNAKDIESIDDIIKWILDETETTKNDIEVVDDDTIFIKPAFDGDGSITIKLDKDNETVSIKHEYAPKMKSNGLSYNAFEDAWDRMTSKAY